MGWKNFSRKQLISSGLFFDIYNINAAIEGLKRLRKIFDNYGIPFFLDCGTLLGCIRDGRLINIDVDVDIGVLGEHWNQDVAKEFKAGRWESSGTQFCKKQNLTDLYFGGEKRAVYFGCAYTVRSSHIPIDVYIHQKGEGEFSEKRINLLTGRRYNVEYFESFVDKKLHNVNFSVPILYEEYLDEIYVGRKNWTIPLLDTK